MATGSRTSRRALLLYALSGAFLLVLVLVVKDLNDKLNVMTHSNMGYQRMTDKQTERIKKLQEELLAEQSQSKMSAKQFKASESDLRQKDQQLSEAEAKATELKQRLQDERAQHERLQEEFQKLSKSNIETSHHVSRLESENAKLHSESERLRQDVLSLQSELSRTAQQYEALFKEHQRSSDAVARLTKDKLRLQEQQKASSPESKQLNQAPNLVQPSSSSTVAKLEPFRPNPRISSTSEQTKVVMPAVADNVAAEPPHAVANPPPAPPPVDSEDVMEAPQDQPQEFRQFLHHPQHIRHAPVLVQQQQQPIERPSVRRQSNFVYHQKPQEQQHFPQQHIFEQPPLHFQRRSAAVDLDHVVVGARHADPHLTEEDEEQDDDVDDQNQYYPARYKVLNQENGAFEEVDDSGFEYGGADNGILAGPHQQRVIHPEDLGLMQRHPQHHKMFVQPVEVNNRRSFQHNLL